MNRPRYREAARELEEYLATGENGARLKAMWDEALRGQRRPSSEEVMWKFMLPHLREEGESLEKSLSAAERKVLIDVTVGKILVAGWALEGFEELLMSRPLRSFLDGKSPWLAQFGYGDYPGEELRFPLDRVTWLVSHDDVGRLRRELGDLGAGTPESGRRLAHFAGLCLHRRELSMTITLS
jgi:hypothetical protein